MRLGQLMEDHMTREFYTGDFCSSLLLTAKQALPVGELIEDQMTKEHYL